MDLIKGVPAKAFIYQDHQAHIQVHTSVANDPIMQQMIGQNPNASQIQAALQAHIAEHLGFAYRVQIEEQLGMPLPAPDEEMPEEVEVQLSRLVAQAATRVLDNSKKQAAEQEAQAQQQDPILQIKMQELQIRAQEAQAKQAAAQAAAQAKQAELQLKQIQAQVDSQIRQQELALKAQEAQAKQRLAESELKLAEDELSMKAELEGTKLGIDIGKSHDKQTPRKGGKDK
jgi:multidrug efflux pump subunit AcrA (membrane-fusion protein)